MGSDASEADGRVLQYQRDTADALDDEEAQSAVVVDTGAVVDIAAVVAAVRGLARGP